MPLSEQLLVHEVFASIQGESTHAGRPCVFVRLTGCNLRCAWCDTTAAFSGGVWRGIEELADEVHGYDIALVELTGGEPLLQAGAVPLMERLIDLGHEVLLETSGSRSIAGLPDPVHVIMDLKPPSSGHAADNLWENLPLLGPGDEVKIVVASREDYDWARDVIARESLHEICPVLLSPAWGAVPLPDLVQWILEDKLPVRLNLQLHKVIWGPDVPGV